MKHQQRGRPHRCAFWSKMQSLKGLISLSDHIPTRSGPQWWSLRDSVEFLSLCAGRRYTNESWRTAACHLCKKATTLLCRWMDGLHHVALDTAGQNPVGVPCDISLSYFLQTRRDKRLYRLACRGFPRLFSTTVDGRKQMNCMLHDCLKIECPVKSSVIRDTSELRKTDFNWVRLFITWH